MPVALTAWTKMDGKEAKKLVQQLFDEGMTSPQAQEFLTALGWSQEQAKTIVLAVINDEVNLEDAQENYKSILIYGILSFLLGLLAIVLTYGRPPSKFDNQLDFARWLVVSGLGLLYTGYQKWKIVKRQNR